jgi:hypothetical protein
MAVALAMVLAGTGAAMASPGLANAAGPAIGSSDAPAPHGLKGEYFKMSAPGARDFAELGGVSLDAEINFAGLTTTFEDFTGQTENTTARWTGQIEAPETTDYTFHAIGDNGFRLFIDDQPVIDHWLPDWDVEQTSAPVRLEAGQRHDIRLEYFQDTGGANMFLRWSSPTTSKQIVPESAFTPPAAFQIFPVDLTVAADGLHLNATFTDTVSGLEGLAGHVVIEADTTPMPIASIALAAGDPLTVVMTLDAPIQKGAGVRFSYDGEGALTVGGQSVPRIIRSASNTSTHRLLTKWGEKLDHANPLPEYPRPQLARAKWLNLNGQWEFAAATAAEQPAFGKTLDERITVPFPVESQLSGLERHEDHMFYRRLISVPRGWNIGDGQRLKLNFGAVDYHAKVWVNGVQVADHTGGFTEFSADITDALVAGSKQEVIVAVTDTTGDNQPVGKQTSNPSGIFYTASSGIWQTVWLEPVADVAVDQLVTTPNLTDSSLAVKVLSAKASPSATITAVAKDAKGHTVGRVTGAANAALRLPVRKPHLWSPDDPYLYGLKVTLSDGSKRDTVESYFGMRSVAIQKVGGYQKLVLNGKPIFSLAQLDQGFWPDGLLTAPSDQALKFDLKAQKALGYNAVRKHIKVEPARWFYHADRLGLLVWQDFVSANITNETGQKAFLDEGREMMSQRHNSPAVIGWIVFNEGWGEWNREETGRIAESVKLADPSRVVNAHSGVNCCSSKGDSGKGDVLDHHDYNNTEPPFPDATRAAMDGEHGGFTLRMAGHMWPGTPAAIYSGVADKAALTAKYVENTEKFYLKEAGAQLSGSIYTQVTDLETELNGLWTYDRKVIKVDPGPVREINKRVIEAGAHAGDPKGPSLTASMSPPYVAVMPSAGVASVQKTTLKVLATAPGDAQVQVRAEAPVGWTVTPSASDLTLDSGGTPVEGTVALSVTVPAGAADGSYEVVATVSAVGVPAVRAVATVLVTHTIDFATGTPAELAWLSDAGGSQIGGVGERYADGARYFVYRFPLPAETTGGTVTLTIDNQFVVQASSDGQTWTTVFTESEPVQDGSNKADRSIDIAPYLGTDKTVYIRVADSFPADGWGGRVTHVNATLN